MWIESDIKITIYLISAALSLVLSIFFLIKSRMGPLLFSYLWLQSIIFFWSIHGIVLDFYETKYNTLSRSELVFGYNYLFYIGYYNACFIGIAWLVFCLAYTRLFQAYQKYFVPVLIVPPALAYYYFAFKKGFIPTITGLGGIYTWIPVMQYTFCALGVFILIRYIFEQQGYPRKQSIFVLLAALVPLILRLTQDYWLFVLRKGRLIPGFDPTPVGFSIGALIIAVAAFRYRFMDFIPAALRNLAGSLKQAIVVTGDSNEILFFNQAFSEFCKPFGVVKKGQSITKYTELIKSSVEGTGESGRTIDVINGRDLYNFVGELILTEGDRRYYSVDIKPLLFKNKEIAGKIITFSDITEYKELVNELNDKNAELMAMNQELTAVNIQLEQYASTVKELTIEKERNRFARDVHDTLGHTMAVLITLLKVSSITCETDPAQTKEKITEALGIAKGGLNELRRSIKGLSPERLAASSLQNALDGLIQEFKISGVNVELTVDGFSPENDTIYSNALFRICQEALTNALRHGKAKNVTIYIGQANDRIKLFIADDGIGAGSINKGFGLAGMEQRIKDLNGMIRYGSDGEKGFNIYADIPLNQEEQIEKSAEG